jgi:endo-1,4-beta-xylanase
MNMPLGAAARLSGRYFGCAARLDQLSADADFKAAVARECGSLTPERDLKWAALEPRRGELDFARLDALVDLARGGGKTVHGHTLVWHRSVPDWAEGALQAPDGWGLVQRYFGSVMPRYGDAIAHWDVVNEPIDPAAPGGLRASPYLRAFGPGYVRRALETARLFAPRARLMINEFGLEYDDADGRARRAALLKLVDRLRRQGAPLDGVGLQSHLDLRRGRIAQRALAGFLGELAARGLVIAVSELDVKEADYILPAAKRDAAVAAATRNYLEVALAEPRVVGVTTGGLSDRYSWLEVTPADLRRWPNAWRDGTSPGLNRGLPLDASLRPKPMYRALLAAFRAAGGKSGQGSII